jgi:hypothetical protein
MEHQHALKNLIVTAWLSSALAGDPPALDSVLEWELSRRLGSKRQRKVMRDTPIEELPRMPIPVAQRTINGVDVYCCSDPILPTPLAPDWVEYINKRIDSSEIALLLDPKERKNLLIASGPYKMQHRPQRVRLVDRVCWFARGNQREMKKLLKSVFSIGQHRGCGYGLIDHWDFEEIERDYSIVAPCRGKPVLMKTVPVGSDLNNVCGYRLSFRGFAAPYWHPANYGEVAIPC